MIPDGVVRDTHAMPPESVVAKSPGPKIKCFCEILATPPSEHNEEPTHPSRERLAPRYPNFPLDTWRRNSIVFFLGFGLCFEDPLLSEWRGLVRFSQWCVHDSR